MKQHNQLVKFKNSFIADAQKKQKLTNILHQDLTATVGQKIKSVIKIYRAQAAQNGYVEDLAYRVIILNLLFPQQEGFNIREEIDRFFRHCLQSQQLSKLQLCFDLLFLKQLSSAIPLEVLRVLKVRILIGLRKNYETTKKRKDMRKCGYTLQQYCKQGLNKDQVKRNTQIYSEILDALIQEMKRKISAAVKRGSKINAVQALTSFIQILEKSQLIVTRKYQLELLQAYWSLAQLHHQMHYLAYTRKYAAIAYNIASRAQLAVESEQIKLLMEKIS